MASALHPRPALVGMHVTKKVVHTMYVEPCTHQCAGRLVDQESDSRFLVSGLYRTAGGILHSHPSLEWMRRWSSPRSSNWYLAPPVSTRTDGHWSDGLLKCTDVVEHEHPFTSPSASGTGASRGEEMTMATGLQVLKRYLAPPGCLVHKRYQASATQMPLCP